MIIFEYIVKNTNDSLKKILKNTISYQEPYTNFSMLYYKNKDKIYFSGSKVNEFIDLTEKTKIQKRKKYGFVYPILQATGRLKKSLISKNSSESIFKITNLSLTIGTSNKYYKYHHRGIKKLPKRQVVKLDKTDKKNLNIEFNNFFKREIRRFF